MAKVPVGLQTIVGYGMAAALAVIAGIEALEASGDAPASVKWLLIIGAAVASLTGRNRSEQAKVLAAAAPAVLSERPESGVTPDDPPPATV